MTLLPKDERTVHLIADGDGSLAAAVGRGAGLSPARVAELLHWGAVYLNKTRVRGDVPIRKGDYLRVHLQPRRFPVAGIDWRRRVVAETDDFVVLDKPPEVPVPPTLDNALENVLHQASEALGMRLRITHRLDMPTQGLLVLAKSRRFQGRFNEWLNTDRVEKSYRALVEREVPAGPLVHYQKPMLQAPKEVSPEPRPGWLRCELVVESCRPHPKGFAVELRLLTGRTHQIRCQLAALGAPIRGDGLYGGAGGEPMALQAFRLRFPLKAAVEPFQFTLPPPW